VNFSFDSQTVKPKIFLANTGFTSRSFHNIACEEDWILSDCTPESWFDFTGNSLFLSAFHNTGYQRLVSYEQCARLLQLGIRVPNSEFITALARKYGHALALTSANESGSSSTLAVHEFEDIWIECAAVLDGGQIYSVVPQSLTCQLLVNFRSHVEVKNMENCRKS